MTQRKKYMPVVQFGEKFSTSSSQYLKLAAKGDRVRIRILGACYIEGKHFLTNGVDEDGKEKWDIIPCHRINDNEKCEYCEQFFALKRKAKKETDKTIIDQYNKKAEKVRPTTFVYYPVIDREKQSFALFQTTIGVRNQIEDEVNLGTKVLSVDFMVLRTDQPGSGFYKLSKVDSADTLELTEKELEAVKEFKTKDITEMINGRYDEESNTAIEANTQVVEEDFASSL